VGITTTGSAAINHLIACLGMTVSVKKKTSYPEKTKAVSLDRIL